MEKRNHIIFFDGVCTLCNASVNFIIDRDKKKVFKFAALQDQKSEEILAGLKINKGLYSILYLENDKVYDQSTAVLRIAKKMDGLWPLAYIFIILPRFLRDGIYKFVAKYRYRWFGKRDVCRIPESAIESRFL